MMNSLLLGLVRSSNDEFFGSTSIMQDALTIFIDGDWYLSSTGWTCSPWHAETFTRFGEDSSMLLQFPVAIKSHEAKPSAISPLYRKRVENIPEFHDCPCYNILIPWLHNGGAISLISHW